MTVSFDRKIFQISLPYLLPFNISTIVVAAGNTRSSLMVNNFLFLAMQHETSYDVSKYFQWSKIKKIFFSI